MFLGDYTFQEMLYLHEKRYPYSHDKSHIEVQFTQFTYADEDFDPVCLKGKFWEIIKLDIIDFVTE